MTTNNLPSPKAASSESRTTIFVVFVLFIVAFFVVLISVNANNHDGYKGTGIVSSMFMVKTD